MKLLKAVKIGSALVLCGFSMTALAGEISAAASRAGCLAEARIQFSILWVYDDVFVRRSCEQAQSALDRGGRAC